MSIHNILASRGNILNGNSYTGVTDSAPYLFRTTGGDTAIGNAKVAFLNKLVGGTVEWNQLLQNGDFSDGTNNWLAESGVTFSVSSGVATFKTDTTNNGIRQVLDVVNGHKYAVFISAWADSACTVRVVLNSASQYLVPFSVGTSKALYSSIKEFTGTTGLKSIYIYANNATDLNVHINYITLIDLTAAFQTAIADHAYALEQQTAGAGIEWLKSQGFDLSKYHAFNAGSLESVYTDSHKEYGFNQWDEEWEVGDINGNTGENQVGTLTMRSKNYIRVIPNTSYCLLMPWANIYYYDANNGYLSYANNGVTEDGAVHIKVITIPANAYYIRFRTTGQYGTTYKNDICINLNKPTGTPKNGDYLPHTEVTYPITPNVLRGKLGLDASNNITYNGDEQYPNGTIKRNYGVRAYEAGDESLADAITDGTNTVYKLTTPTTETTDPYTNPQTVFVGGTEEFTDYGVAQGQ